jgi:hypothetical protein
MKKLDKLYRTTYSGEHVTTELTLANKQWNATQTWIGNSVVNNQISNQAVVIGNGISRKEFDLNPVFNHFGGLLATQKLQTYGCNSLIRDFKPDFLVASGDAVKEVAESGYCDNNIVYSTAMHITEHPGKFYLTPQDPAWPSGSVAAYLAAFDGHKKVYLVGFDSQDTAGFNYNCYAGTTGYQAERNAQCAPDFLEQTMKVVFDTYQDVDFVRVMQSQYAWMPESWRYSLNLRQISFRDFVLEANL